MDFKTIMAIQEWSQIWHNSELNLDLIQAYYVHHAYPRHSHDYYVLCVIEQGLQSFTHNGKKHTTPPGGVILINPGETHTGESAGEEGFQMLSLYPTIRHMETAAYELTGRHQELPFFKEVRVDDPWANINIRVLYKELVQGAGELEWESCFTWTLARLIKRYADLRFQEQPLGNEKVSIDRARRYINDNYSQGISLNQLAAQVSLSPFYLLRAFRAEVGMPPHAYQESVRIRHAQRLIESGKSLAEVAAEVGFSSQSHLTSRFKRIIGVTPGKYAEQIH